MKRNLIISLVLLVVAFTACEKENKNMWPTSDLENTAVYSVYNIQGDTVWNPDENDFVEYEWTGPYGYDVYREKPIMLSFKSDNKRFFVQYDIANYVDASNDILYNISYTAYFDEKIDEEKDTTIIKYYQVDGEKSSGIGNMQISQQSSPSDTTMEVGYYTVMIDELMVYTEK